MICFIQCRILTASGRENKATPFPHCTGTKKPLLFPISHAYSPQHKARLHICAAGPCTVRFGFAAQSMRMSATE